MVSCYYYDSSISKTIFSYFDSKCSDVCSCKIESTSHRGSCTEFHCSLVSPSHLTSQKLCGCCFFDLSHFCFHWFDIDLARLKSNFSPYFTNLSFAFPYFYYARQAKTACSCHRTCGYLAMTVICCYHLNSNSCYTSSVILHAHHLNWHRCYHNYSTYCTGWNYCAKRCSWLCST